MIIGIIPNKNDGWILEANLMIFSKLCDKIVSEQLKKSSSRIFLMGIGHVKSALIHRLPKYRNAIYLDIGSGIDALAGMIDIQKFKSILVLLFIV